MGGKDIHWEEPTKKSSFEKEYPTDIFQAVRRSKISVDKKGIFFVRFPREMSDTLDLSKGDMVEFKITKPLKSEKKEDAFLSVNIVRGVG